MFLYAPPVNEYVNISPVHTGASLTEDRSWRRGALGPATLQGVLCETVHAGQFTYPLRVRLAERIGPNFYSLEGFFPHIVGGGKTPIDAREDFARKVHMLFQEVDSTAEFERTDKQQRLWGVFAGLIDLRQYESAKSITVTQIGQITRRLRAGRVRVRWATGLIERIDIAKASPEFAVLKVGQWFEAVVRRDYLSDRLLAIEHVSGIRKPEYGPEEREQFWSLGTRQRAGDAAAE